MASKIEGRSFDAPIKEYTFSGKEYNTLRVHVDYSPGYYAQGGYFYARLTPEFVEVSTGGFKVRSFAITGTQDPLGSWTTIQLKAAPKNSRKTIEQLSAALELAKEAIGFFFDKRDWPMLKWLVESVAAVGYTHTIVAKVQEHMAKNNETTNNINEQKSEETMAKKLQAVDLIGKVIIVGENIASIEIKGADGDTLQGEFKKGDAPAIPMPIKLENLEKMIADGVWRLQGESTATADTVEEVEDVQPKATEVKMKPEVKPKSEAKPKSEKPKSEKPKTKSEPKTAKTVGTLTYSTYQNKKGKTCARISDFSENHPAYVNCSDLHGSASYEKDKKGNKTFYLVFGPRYAEAAKAVCEALNNGKSLADCKVIIDRATEERAQQREEWKAKRQEHNAQAEGASTGSATAKGYTAEEVAAIIDRVLAGEDIPEDIRKHIKAAA